MQGASRGKQTEMKRPILIRLTEAWELIAAVKLSFTPQPEEIVACEQNEAIAPSISSFAARRGRHHRSNHARRIFRSRGRQRRRPRCHSLSPSTAPPVDSFYGYVMLAINTQFQPFLLSINLNAGADYGKIAFQHELFASTATIISMDARRELRGGRF